MYTLSYGLLTSTAGFASQVLVPHIFQVAGSCLVKLISTRVSYPSDQRVIEHPANRFDSLFFVPLSNPIYEDLWLKNDSFIWVSHQHPHPHSKYATLLLQLIPNEAPGGSSLFAISSNLYANVN